MTAIDKLLDSLKVEATVFHNGQYCGAWAIDTSGKYPMTFHIISRGHCYLKFKGQTYGLKEGDSVFFPSDSPHKICDSPNNESIEMNEAQSLLMTDTTTSSATGLVCGYLDHHHPLFTQLTQQLPNLIIIRHDSSLTSSRIIHLISKESRCSGQNTNLLLNRLSDCLFYLLIRDHLDVDTGIFAAFHHSRLHKVMDAIHQSCNQKITLNQLADLALMSRSAFSSLFKKIVGETPINYINQWRMAQAYRWLADEQINTYTVALRCGYDSEAAFSKAFKRVIGIGPGQARAKVNKKA